MKITKSAVDTAVVWCIFCDCFSTDIYKDVIIVNAQKLKAKERDLQYWDTCITFNPFNTKYM